MFTDRFWKRFFSTERNSKLYVLPNGDAYKKNTILGVRYHATLPAHVYGEEVKPRLVISTTTGDSIIHFDSDEEAIAARDKIVKEIKE